MVAVYDDGVKDGGTVLQTLGMSTTSIVEKTAQPETNMMPEVSINSKRTYWWLIAIIAIIVGGLVALKK